MTKEFGFEFKEYQKNANQFYFLKNDDFDNIIPLYDIHYSEQDLTPSQIEKMSELDELMMKAAFSI